MDMEAVSNDSLVAEAISNRRRSNSVSDDYSVQRTNDDATQCKFFAVQKGYWSDDFIARFANSAIGTAETRRFPEISMGYWARTKIVETYVRKFLAKHEIAQVISLGCGFDTLFWRLSSSEGGKLRKYVEIDFSSVTSKKIRHILKPGPKPDPAEFFEEKATIQQHSDLHAGNYHLIGADLRQLKELEQKLEQCQIDATIPTIFIAECVLVYMSADASANLLEFFAQKFSAATEFLNYEQFRAADAFTKVMEQNLEQRGIHLHGLQMCESEEKQVERFKNAGFKNVQVYDMNRVFKELLDQKEAARIQKIDFLDEMELLYQLLAHYCIVHAEK